MAADPSELGLVTIGVFAEENEDSEVVSPRSTANEHHRKPTVLYEGLGGGPGAQLVRSCLSQAGSAVLDSAARSMLDRENQNARQFRSDFLPVLSPASRLATPRVAQDSPCASSPRVAGDVLAAAGGLGVAASPAADRRTTCRRSADLREGGGEREPQGAFMALLQADAGPASGRLLKHIESHRWTFTGAVEMAARGRGYSCFVWCLLQMQQQLQTQEECDPLDAPLTSACRLFVGKNTSKGRTADMYQMLTHFLCNSIVWHEWHKFLRASFEDSRAGTEAFLVPRLEQVWGRFQRLRAALVDMFGVLDDRFAWKHRLPKVGDLLLEHMRKRCFPLDLVDKNELFKQATIKDETLKQIKFSFDLT